MTHALCYIALMQKAATDSSLAPIFLFNIQTVIVFFTH